MHCKFLFRFDSAELFKENTPSILFRPTSINVLIHVWRHKTHDV